MRQLIRECISEVLSESLPVIEDYRQEKYYRCPHCKKEIHEKHDFLDENGVTRHSDCGGAFKWPPVDPNTISPEWREALLPYLNK